MKVSLVLHAHQPPGNFDSVFRRAMDTCYRPVLDLIEARPAVRISLHASGSLLEWVEAHDPEWIDQVRRLVERGQVEVVAAGMYEPVLSLLPKHDRIGQLRTHRAYLAQLFGTDARSGWLTERVWEPALAADLVEGGIERVTLDDRLLLSAGLPLEALDVPYVTESQGHVLRIAPAAEDLRMVIPWHPVDEVLALIQRKARAGVRMGVYADDIEKFGMWPDTYRNIIKGRWLARFLDGLVRLDDIEVVPLGEAVEALPVAGRVYVPDGTYPEMLDWSLPPAAQHAIEGVRGALRARGLYERASPFVRAGHYHQFLAKYPEVNHLHKRMLDVSARIAARFPHRGDSWDPAGLPEAQLDIWRAQANCAYWHGLFGGAYLPHIRQRLWHHLLRAERALEDAGERRRAVRVFDLDADGEDEIMVTTPALVAVVDPAEGALVELSDRERAVNLVDTLSRREEGYHGSGAEAPYVYDRGRRACFVDRVLASGTPPGRRSDVEDVGDFEGQPYEPAVRRRREDVEVTLTREGDAPGGRLRIEKRLRFRDAGAVVEAAYRVEPAEGSPDGRFAVELNFGLLFTEHPRGELVAGGRTLALPRGGAVGALAEASLTMDALEAPLRLEVDPPADLDVRPIATVSRSEGGFDRTPQQLAVLLSWPLPKDGAAFEATIRLAIGEEAPR
ncbi:MAG: alpha-amylase/4-alpha-glucanotransferase domain-containing protein [Acidimicrobiia bacterium]